jgi:hypothetical protein
MEKLKKWWESTGMTNLAFLAVGIGGKILMGSNLILGAGLGIFLYVNFNVIRKLFKESQLENKSE